MTNFTQDTIRSTLALLDDRLARASTLVSMAHEAIKSGEQNLAIGTLLPLQQEFADIDTLLRTVFLLHRSKSKPSS